MAELNVTKLLPIYEVIATKTGRKYKTTWVLSVAAADEENAKLLSRAFLLAKDEAKRFMYGLAVTKTTAQQNLTFTEFGGGIIASLRTEEILECLNQITILPISSIETIPTLDSLLSTIEGRLLTASQPG